MKFHKYALSRTVDGGVIAGKKTMSNSDWYITVCQRLMDDGKELDHYNFFLEMNWLKHDRPFYNVWPAVVTCLKNTSMNLRPSQICEVQPTCICFAEGHEVDAGEKGKVRSAIFNLSHKSYDMKKRELYDNLPAVTICAELIRPSGKLGWSAMAIHDDENLLDKIKNSPETGGTRLVQSLFPLCIGISLLAQSQEFAEPILLNRDKNKLFSSDEQRQRAVDRAHKRGVHGVEIGRNLEVSPHVRRPHLGIRWTGKGKAIPKLVPVKGCLVNHSKLFPIPTGYLGEND